MTTLPHPRPKSPPPSQHRQVPKVGDLAWHYGGLDPRPVAKVSKDKSLVNLLIGSTLTGWCPAENYTYTDGGRG